MNRRTLYITSATAILALIGVITMAMMGVFGRTEKLRLASGTSGSGIHDLGTALAEVFNSKVEGVKVTVVESDEVRNSLETVLNGEAELAVAFSDSKGDGDIRTIVPLYELYLYVVVWNADDITDVPSLAGRRIGLGPVGSGTNELSRRLLDHYSFGEDTAELVNAGYRDTTKLFKNRELDAVFILGSTESKAVSRMLALEGTELLSLDDPERVAPAMDGIRSNNPFVVSHVIPKHLFGSKPTKPTGVIGVNALLVARADVEDESVRRLTEAVFQHKVALGTKIRKLREIDEHFDRGQLRFPLHPGQRNTIDATSRRPFSSGPTPSVCSSRCWCSAGRVCWPSRPAVGRSKKDCSTSSTGSSNKSRTSRMTIPPTPSCRTATTGCRSFAARRSRR